MKLLGVNYIDPATKSWPPHPWQDFNPDRLDRDFKTASKMGLILIRQFLTAGSFLPTPHQVDSRALKKLTTYLKIASKHRLQVILTGPDHWEGWPDWVPQNRFQDPLMKQALTIFWETLAKKFKGNPTIYGWDILNEPYLDYPVSGYEQAEEIATTFVKFQSQTIKKYDHTHPVTLGFLQYAFPLKRTSAGDPSGYNPFQPSLLAPYLDFMSIHFYPSKKLINFYEDNLEYLLAWVAYAKAAGKPVQLGEFGMWGQGQNRWGKMVMENTYDLLDSWLNWPLVDVKQATDISSKIGLISQNGQLKKWGQTFSDYAKGKQVMAKTRKIVPLKLNKQKILTKQSVEKDFLKLIKDQKQKKIIYQIKLIS